MHKCLVKLNRYEEAIEVLQSVPAKHRTPRINFALAELLHHSGAERSAITAYKEVLRVSTDQKAPLQLSIFASDFYPPIQFTNIQTEFSLVLYILKLYYIYYYSNFIK